MSPQDWPSDIPKPLPVGHRAVRPCRALRVHGACITGGPGTQVQAGQAAFRTGSSREGAPAGPGLLAAHMLLGLGARIKSATRLLERRPQGTQKHGDGSCGDWDWLRQVFTGASRGPGTGTFHEPLRFPRRTDRCPRGWTLDSDPVSIQEGTPGPVTGRAPQRLQSSGVVARLKPKGMSWELYEGPQG